MDINKTTGPQGIRGRSGAKAKQHGRTEQRARSSGGQQGTAFLRTMTALGMTGAATDPQITNGSSWQHGVSAIATGAGAG